MHRGDVDDRPTLDLAHLGNGVFAAEIQCFQQNVKTAVPVRLLEFDDRSMLLPVGVVDQYVEPAEALDGGADHVPDLGMPADIGMYEAGLAAGGADLGGGALAQLVLNVGDEHLGPLARERTRNLAPDPLSCPGHNSGLAVQT